MYEVGMFKPPSAYAGLRVLFDADVFTIENCGPVDVRLLPGFATSGEFVWSDDAARVWAEEHVRAASPASAATAAPGRNRSVAWIAGIAALLVLGLCGLGAMWALVSPGPGTTDVRDPYGPPIVTPDQPPAHSGQTTLVGTWQVTQGANRGSTYRFDSNGRAWWSGGSGDSWEYEWSVAADGSVSLRRGRLTTNYAVQMSADRGTMQWTDLSTGQPTTVLARVP